LFIEENLKAREEQVLGTAEFIDRELDKARKELSEKGRRLEALRARYSSELPEAQNAHVQALASEELELRGDMDAISRAQQQKVYLEAMEAQSPAVVDLDSGNPSDTGLEEQLARLQGEQDQLRARYGPYYPDVVKTSEEILRVQAQIRELAKSSPSNSAPPSILKRHNPVIESQIEALEQEIQKHTARQDELKSEIHYHQSMLNQTPAVAQQLAVLTRDYDQAADNYKLLQNHKFDADISSSVETRQKGERFLILEAAQPPTRAYQPKRLQLDALGLIGGLGIGLFLVLALEVLDTTVKTKREVTEQLPIPVFGEIPWLTTKANQHRQMLRLRFAASAITVLAGGYLGIVALSLQK
jgi:polysaccharide biosynthesis transport protein